MEATFDITSKLDFYIYMEAELKIIDWNLLMCSFLWCLSRNIKQA